MRTSLKYIILLALATVIICGTKLFAQDSAEVAEPAVKLRYFQQNNSLQYLIAESVLKGKKSEPLPKQVLKIFLDSASAENLICKTYTDEKGKAKIFLPPAMKEKWMSSTMHNFIAVLEATSAEEERSVSLEITKAKLKIDTVNEDGIRSVKVDASYLENDQWLPAADVELKVGIQRLGSILSAGEDETYTTDSTGSVVIEFNKDSLPGNEKGNLILVAKVEDNDRFGNLLVETSVPWGVRNRPTGDFFDQRELWARSSATPWWLLFMAGAIVFSVWGTIIYLIVQLVRIKKEGKLAAKIAV